MSVQSSWPVALISQEGIAAVVPAAGSEALESDRLRAARIWSYAFTMQQYEQPPYFLVRIDDGQIRSGSEPCTVLTEIEALLHYDGDTVSVQLHRLAGDVAMRDVAFIPLDLAHQPLEFVRIDDDADHSSLRYVSDQGHGVFTLRIHALPAPEVPAARAGVATQSNAAPVGFAEPLRIALDRTDEFRVDRLSGTEGRVQPLALHLRDMLRTVFGDVAQCTIRIACSYASAPPLSSQIPVLLVASADCTRERSNDLADDLARAIGDWQQTTAIADGDLLFDLSVLSGLGPSNPPCLRLTALRLPVAAIADFPVPNPGGDVC